MERWPKAAEGSDSPVLPEWMGVSTLSVIPQSPLPTHVLNPVRVERTISSRNQLQRHGSQLGLASWLQICATESGLHPAYKYLIFLDLWAASRVFNPL